MATTTDAAAPGVTVDELAREVGLPVRTIREYQTLRLLPPPVRDGRIGRYGAEHRRRLDLIARLQQRGYSLAGIRDLLAAWEAGANLHALLGLDVGAGALDETPLLLTRTELYARVPALRRGGWRRAEAAGLVQAHGRDRCIVRSPSLLALVADAVAAGVDVSTMLDLVGALRDELGSLAELIADEIVERVWDPLAAADRAADVEPLLRRGRLLLLQGVASVLADRLGDALVQRADHVTNGDELRAAIDHIRIGAVTDSQGNIRRRA